MRAGKAELVGAIEAAVVGLHERAVGDTGVSGAEEAVDHVFRAGGLHLEQDTAAVEGSATGVASCVSRCAVKVAVAAQGEEGAGVAAVGLAGEGVEDLVVSGAGDLVEVAVSLISIERSSELSIRCTRVPESLICAVEAAVGALGKRAERLVAVAAVGR